MRWLISSGLIFSAFVTESATAAVHPGFWAGNQLLSECRAVSSDSTYFQNQANCRAYIMGVDDAMSMVMEIQSKEIYCTPTGVTAGQEKDIVVSFLESHPESRHKTAGSLVTAALMAAFPCQK